MIGFNMRMAGGGGAYLPNTTRFSGDYLYKTTHFTSLANGKKGIISFWIKMMGADGVTNWILSNNYITSNSIGVGVYRNTSNKIDLVMRYSDAPGEAIRLTSTSSVTGSSGWKHVLASWDAGNNLAHLYVHDAQDEGTKTINNQTIQYVTGSSTGYKWAVGSHAELQTAALDAEIIDLWFDPVNYLDITQAVNRRKFISPDKKPMFLGATGAIPTSTAPILFLSGLYSSFPTNKGTGGGMSVSGTLAAGASRP